MKKFTILIIEDNDDYRRLLKRTLQSSFPSIAIDEAGDERGALEKVNVLLPDLIFMDIRLPDANGLELTKKIKTTLPNIRIVILTYYDLPEYRQAALQNGAEGFFVKTSLSAADLEELVKRYLKS